MISYLPELYPDELVYSWFCRLYIHGGYLTHKAALADLFEKRSCNPSKEFIGYLNADAKKIISSVIPINNLVAEHTMFPQYARFFPSDEKLAALRLLGEGSTDPHHLLTILVRNPSSEWMRYCPLCVNADREKYGETYWHRSHQIRNVNICPKHRCHLINSSVSIRNESAFSFYPAQTTVRDTDVIYSQNELEHRFTDYCAELVAAPISFQKAPPISSVLYKAMKYTPYMKSTGKSRYTKRFYEDITDFYSRINLQNQITFTQIQRALLGNLAEFTTITQIAFFLGITVEELINPDISEAEITEEQESHYMRGSTPVDWEQLDNDTAPVLEKLAYEIYNGVNSRPDRVSEKMVCRELGLLGHQIENLPKCAAILKRYEEPYGSAWARRIIWAYDKLLEERREKPFYWSDIRTLAGVKKSNLDKIKPFLPKFTTSEKTAAIIALIDGN